MQAAGPTTGRHLRAAQKVATIQLKFGVHPGNPGYNDYCNSNVPAVLLRGQMIFDSQPVVRQWPHVVR